MLTLLAFSDLHRSTSKAQAIVARSGFADILISAGDLCTGAEGLADTLDILRSAEKPLILVAGNHDSLSAMQDYTARWPDTHVLHGHSITLMGQCFFGLGGETPNSHSDTWNFALEEEAATSLLAPCPPNAVLITHAPPFGTADLQKNGQHEGSHAIRAATLAKHPRLHLCGHIHNAWGSSGTLGQTPVHNLGPKPHFFTLTTP